MAEAKKGFLVRSMRVAIGACAIAGVVAPVAVAQDAPTEMTETSETVMSYEDISEASNPDVQKDVLSYRKEAIKQGYMSEDQYYVRVTLCPGGHVVGPDEKVRVIDHTNFQYLAPVLAESFVQSEGDENTETQDRINKEMKWYGATIMQAIKGVHPDISVDAADPDRYEQWAFADENGNYTQESDNAGEAEMRRDCMSQLKTKSPKP